MISGRQMRLVAEKERSESLVERLWYEYGDEAEAQSGEPRGEATPVYQFEVNS